MIDTQAEAHKLHRSKLPITLCPPDSKKPLGEGWDATQPGKKWQSKRWTLKEIDRAFRLLGELNVGVLFGPESRLIDVEEDSPEDRTAYSRLMEGCPPAPTATFKSKRGPHRLFAWRPELEKLGKATIHFDGLEIKIGANGKGAHSLFPPSVSGGVAREWVNPLDDCPAVPIPDRALERLFESRLTEFCRTAADGRKGNSGTQRTQRSHEITVSSASSVYPSPKYITPSPAIQSAVAATLPTKSGIRHRCIFGLARHLKAIPELVGADDDTLRPIVAWWHEVALPVITTKPFEETWFDFRNAWQAVKFAAGEEPISSMFANAISKPTPKCAEKYQQQQLRSLVALCRELQQTNGKDKPFYLAGRIAAEQIGVDHKTAARWLKMLCMDGVLYLVEQGTRHQASEYRYLGD